MRDTSPDYHQFHRRVVAVAIAAFREVSGSLPWLEVALFGILALGLSLT